MAVNAMLMRSQIQLYPELLYLLISHALRPSLKPTEINTLALHVNGNTTRSPEHNPKSHAENQGFRQINQQGCPNMTEALPDLSETAALLMNSNFHLIPMRNSNETAARTRCCSRDGSGRREARLVCQYFL